MACCRHKKVGIESVARPDPPTTQRSHTRRSKRAMHVEPGEYTAFHQQRSAAAIDHDTAATFVSMASQLRASRRETSRHSVSSNVSNSATSEPQS